MKKTRLQKLPLLITGSFFALILIINLSLVALSSNSQYRDVLRHDLLGSTNLMMLSLFPFGVLYLTGKRGFVYKAVPLVLIGVLLSLMSVNYIAGLWLDWFSNPKEIKGTIAQVTNQGYYGRTRGPNSSLKVKLKLDTSTRVWSLSLHPKDYASLQRRIGQTVTIEFSPHVKDIINTSELVDNN